MEAAVTAGYVNTVEDVADFCRGRLATSGLVSAAFAAAACTGWYAEWAASDWRSLDAELSARMPSAATRTASRSLGSGLRRLLLATVPEAAEVLAAAWADCPPPAPHQPLVLGAAAGLVGATPRLAALAAAMAACTGPASAAVRLLGLDPYAVHAMTSSLAPLIEALADQAALAATDDLDFLPANSAPALDLLADVHAQAEVRLFAS